MSVIQILGLVAAAVCLLAYWRGNARVFDWCNATLWPVVALASLEAQAWGPLLLNLGFGSAGVWHLWKGRTPSEAARKKRIRERANKVLTEAADGHVLYYNPPGDR